MKIRPYFLAVAATLVSLPTLAADIDGKWSASVESPQGAINLVFELKAEGEKLTGTMSSEMLPAATPLAEGTIKGADVAFKLSIQIAPDAPPLVVAYKGTLKGDDLNLNSLLDMGQGPVEMPMVAKRTK